MNQLQLKKISYFFCLIVFIGVSTINAQNKVFGYYPDWVKYRMPVEKIEFDKITHLLHSFVFPDTNGNLVVANDFINQNLINQASANDVKVLISIGGADQSDGFSKAATVDSLREKLANNIVQFVIDNNYDGIDIDWEFPSNENEKNGLTNLVNSIRQKFDAENKYYEISIAIPATDFLGKWFDYENLKSDTDYFFAMTYNYYGKWSDKSGHNAALFNSGGDAGTSIDESFTYLKNRNLPDEKLVLGTSFFGRIFWSVDLNAQNDSSETEDLTYYQIVDEINQGSWDYFWDETAKVPYRLNSDRTRFMTYENEESITHKTQYVIDNNYAGIMIWALSYDLLGDDSQPLLAAIDETFNSQTAVAENNNLPVDFRLSDNYPNPFNPSTKISIQAPVGEFVELKVFDITGREIKILHSGKLNKGSKEFIFNAVNLSSGVYFYRMTSEHFAITKKMMLLK